MTNKVTFNKNEVYNKEIVGKVHELKVLCKKENIPFFFAACVGNNDVGSKYELEMLSPAICDTKLADDWISKFVAISRGFDAVPREKVVELDVTSFLVPNSIDDL